VAVLLRSPGGSGSTVIEPGPEALSAHGRSLAAKAHTLHCVSTPVPAVVTIDVWGVRPHHVPAAMWRTFAVRRLRQDDDVLFAKFLGTGDGRTFAPRDADLRHWAVLVCWRTEEAAIRFPDTQQRAWERIAVERLRLRLLPLTSRGRWSGSAPFGEPGRGRRHDGPVAAITRARLVPWRARALRRSVPTVAKALAGHDGDGLLLALGVGESPVGLQGTLSVWTSPEALERFAHGGAHREAVRQARQNRWFAEELFARLAVLAADGTYKGAEIFLPRR
jgi:hypothetical protein